MFKPGLLCRLSGGSNVEEHSPIDVVGHEPWRSLGHPQRLRDLGYFCNDLRCRVAATDDDDSLASEVLGRIVVNGVQLPTSEVLTAGIVRDVGGAAMFRWR